MSEPRFEVQPITALKPDARNPRKHGPRNQQALVDSLRQFGGARSIVVDRDGVVRAGNGTVEAAKAAGITDVLVVEPAPGQIVAVRRPEWSEAKAAAYAIADNRAGELAEWDCDVLGRNLAEIQGEFSIDALGFDERELQKLIGAATAYEPPPMQPHAPILDQPDDEGGAEGDHDDEDDERPARVVLFPLAIALTRRQVEEWHALKTDLGMRKDTDLLLHLVAIARPPSE